MDNMQKKDGLLWSGYKVPADVAGWLYSFVTVAETYPACSGHADEVAGKRAAAEWDKCKNKQVFYFNLGKALELGKKSYPAEFVGDTPAIEVCV